MKYIIYLVDENGVKHKYGTYSELVIFDCLIELARMTKSEIRVEKVKVESI